MFRLDFTDSYGVTRNVFCDSFDFYTFDDGYKAVAVVKPHSTRIYELVSDMNTIFRPVPNEQA